MKKKEIFKECCIVFTVLLAILVSPGFLFAATPNEKVEGLWIELPGFADFDGEITSEFRTGTKGEVFYERRVDKGALLIRLERFPARNDEGKNFDLSNVKEYVADKAGIDQSDVSITEDLSDFVPNLSYPVSGAEYETKEGMTSRQNADLFVFTDDWVFLVHCDVAEDSKEEYKELALEAIKSLQFFLGEEMPASDEDLDEKNPVAVVFTGENYTGISWKIESAAEYDLRDNFNLPNDSVCSIKVRPGYSVTIFEHSEFGGEKRTFDNDTPSFEKFWKRQASSLIVEVAEKDKVFSEEAEAWRAGTEKDMPFKAFLATNLEEDQLKEAVEKYKGKIESFQGMFVDSWYGDTTDDERIAMAGELLEIFDAYGFDVSEWSSNSLAQQMSNYFDWHVIENISNVACFVLGIELK